MCEEFVQILKERMDYSEPTCTTIELTDGDKLEISNTNRKGRRDVWGIMSTDETLILEGRGCHIELPFEDIDVLSWEG